MPLNQKAVYALISRLVGQANVLTIPRVFIDLTGDHVTALLLSQIIYWSSRTDDPEGWFYKSAKDWEAELGISDYQLARATKKLVDAGVATRLRKVNGAPTLHYRLDEQAFLEWISEKLGNGFPTPSAMDSRATAQPLMESETTPETTDRESFEASKGLSTGVDKYDADRDVILNYVSDFAREFADQAPLASSVTRAQNLYRSSGLDLEAFVDLMYKARSITKERSASVRTRPDESGKKQKMPYFFAVLEDLVRQRTA